MIKIDCDSHSGKVYIDDNGKYKCWEKIPITEWLRLMEIILPKSINDKYFESDYRGVISKKRYESGKIYYKKICRIFKLEDTSDEQN